VLTSTNGTWAGAAVTIARQWLRCSATGDQCVTIAGATSATYTTVAADRNLRCACASPPRAQPSRTSCSPSTLAAGLTPVRRRG